MPPLEWLRPAAAPSGYAAFLAGFLEGTRPPVALDVSAWAAAHRFVSAESGSPYPGKWDAGLTPYTREVEQCLSDADPCRDVVVVKSAQTAFTEVGINLFGGTVDQAPAPMAIVLPTTDEARKFNKIKLQPTIDATPRLKRAILEVKSRDEDSSTASFKRFRGGFCVVTGANSATGLQMISARKIICEEVSGYPPDAGGRGDPIEQILSRSKAWNQKKPGPKRYYPSTPNIKGDCRVTALYEVSDQRRYYVPCPHCGVFQPLRWGPERAAGALRWRQETRPFGAHYICAANGCVIEPFHRRRMVELGVWIKSYDGGEANPPPPALVDPDLVESWRARSSMGREPGFHLWQAYSPFVSWDDTVEEYLKAKDNPLRLKVFYQQALGEAWEERGEAPPAEQLVERREGFALRRLPYGALFVTAMADVQKDRLEYGVYAWARAMREGWLIDHGVIAGAPEADAPWDALARILNGTYEDHWGRPQDIDAFGIDAGYLSDRVYRFCYRHARETPEGTRQVFALDGRAGWRKPPLGTPSSVAVDYAGRKIGAVLLWPVATFDMKSLHYHALRCLIEGPDKDGRSQPGTVHYGMDCDLEYFQQLTAEHLVDTIDRGVPQRVWANPNRNRNEALDIAVGARALAHHIQPLDEARWARLVASRGTAPDDPQQDLGALWSPPLGAAPSRALVDPAASGPVRAVEGASRRLNS